MFALRPRPAQGVGVFFVSVFCVETVLFPASEKGKPSVCSAIMNITDSLGEGARHRLSDALSWFGCENPRSPGDRG